MFTFLYIYSHKIDFTERAECYRKSKIVEDACYIYIYREPLVIELLFCVKDKVGSKITLNDEYLEK